VVHIFFPLTATVASSISTDGCAGFGPIPPEEKASWSLSRVCLCFDVTTSPHVLKSVPSRFKELQGKVVVL